VRHVDVAAAALLIHILQNASSAMRLSPSQQAPWERQINGAIALWIS